MNSVGGEASRPTGSIDTSRLDYDDMAAAYPRARHLAPEDLSDLKAALSLHLPPASGLVVDVGSGTGTFAAALASWFDCEVLAVEPNRYMRQQAQRHASHPLVRYVDGDAASIPLPDGQAGAAWLSAVVHHVADLDSMAAELARVLAAGAPIIVRSVFPDRLDRVRLFEYFPEARDIAARFPSVTDLASVLGRAGWALHLRQRVAQRSAVSLTEAIDMVSHRADTTLALVDDDAFEAGLARMRADLARRPGPVVDQLDLLVFHDHRAQS